MLKHLSLIAIAFVMVGCTTAASNNPCVKLKRELIYNESNRNIEADWSTSEQRKAYRARLAAANCK